MLFKLKVASFVLSFAPVGKQVIRFQKKTARDYVRPAEKVVQGDVST